MPEIFTLVVLIALTSSVVLRLWLSLRQTRFVATHRGATPEAFAHRISLAAHQQAADYTLAKAKLERIELIIETLLFVAFTWGGILAALHGFWTAHFTGIAYGIALIASVLLLSGIIDLPLELYRQFRLEARFGFNRMTPALFIADKLKQFLVSCLLGLPLLAAILWLMQATGAYWWLYAWLLWMSFNLLVLFIYPLWIAPWFNKFTPLADGEVKTRVEALLQRGAFGNRELFVMDGSRRSSHGNAYFTGFGKARRIVFFDTLINRLTPAQIEAVLAHELGHFHHRHIVKRMAGIFALSLAFLALLGLLLHTPWFFQGLGVGVETSGNTALALVLFGLVVPLFAFLTTPLFSFLSRRDEFQADTYAARIASADELAAALVKLYEDNAATLTPDPLHSRFYDSHPPAAERIQHLQSLAPSGAPA
ncbi:integral membrane zinc-metalloprotease [Betaproteobacteria bacterium]|nr:integral membrane zinc-metalloprotease [Betaproteobacteria bacterium]GHU45135.1 integral membrane zinc-metalloprotease [Betaproteobacteria bacterium]